MRKTRKNIEHAHAQKRFIQRSGVYFTKNLNIIFCNFIRSGKATFIKRTSLRVTLWDIPYEGKLYRCVYDKIRKQIVTVLFMRGIPVND